MPNPPVAEVPSSPPNTSTFVLYRRHLHGAAWRGDISTTEYVAELRAGLKGRMRQLRAVPRHDNWSFRNWRQIVAKLSVCFTRFRGLRLEMSESFTIEHYKMDL